MNDGNSEYGLVCSFGIDDGELDGLSPQEVFTLGFEMGRTYGTCEQLDHGDAASFMTHSSNRSRNDAAAKAQKCAISHEWNNDDWLRTIVSK